MGYVYCFANDCMQGILKIGMTERTIEERLSEANSSDTWRPPTLYTIVCSVKVNNPKKKEKILHEILKEFRVNIKREFFRVSIDKIRLLFDLMDDSDYQTIAPAVSRHHDRVATSASEGIRLIRVEVGDEYREIKYKCCFSEFDYVYIHIEPDGKINEVELYDVFTNWYMLVYRKFLPKDKDLFEYVTKTYPKITKIGNTWHGLTIICP